MNNRFVPIVKAAILQNGKLLIVQRAKNEKVAGGTWECPGGKVEFGEDLETALKREVKEETGLNINVKKILYASVYNSSDSSRQFIILTYLSSGDNDHTVTLSNEHMNYQWVSKAQAKSLLAPNIIRDFEKNKVFYLKDWL
jgi:8-oxo-dGTP diphosphatase